MASDDAFVVSASATGFVGTSYYGRYYGLGLGFVSSTYVDRSIWIDMFNLTNPIVVHNFTLSPLVGLYAFGLTAISEQLFLTGGIQINNANYSAASSMWTMRLWNDDITRSSWVSGVPMPEPRLGHTMIDVAGELFVFGGQDPLGNASKKTLFFNIQSNAWRFGPSLIANRPSPIYLRAVYAQGFIFISGGDSSAIEILNLASPLTWVLGTPLMNPRSGALMFYDEVIYFLGGFKTPYTVEVFNISSNTYSIKPNLTFPITFAAGFMIRTAHIVIDLTGPSVQTCYSGFFTVNINLTFPGVSLLSSGDIFQVFAPAAGDRLLAAMLVSSTNSSAIWKVSWRVSQMTTLFSNFEEGVLRASRSLLESNNCDVLSYSANKLMISLQHVDIPIYVNDSNADIGVAFTAFMPLLQKDFLTSYFNQTMVWKLKSTVGYIDDLIFSNLASCAFVGDGTECYLQYPRGSGTNLSLELWIAGEFISRSNSSISYPFPTIFNASLRPQYVVDGVFLPQPAAGSACQATDKLQGFWSFQGTRLLPKNTQTQIFHGPKNNRTQHLCTQYHVVNHTATIDTVVCLLDPQAALLTDFSPQVFSVSVMGQFIEGNDRLDSSCGCPPGEEFFSSGCVPCSRGFSKPLTIGKCEKCIRGSFSNVRGSTSCLTCLEGLRCEDGIGTAIAGFWFDPDSGVAYACPPKLCRGEGQCAPGRDTLPLSENVLCGTCNSGYVGAADGSCVSCSVVHGEILFLLIIVTFFYTVFILVQAKESKADLKIFVYFTSAVRLFLDDDVGWLGWLSFFELSPNINSSFCVLPMTEYQRLASRLLFPTLMLFQLFFVAGIHKILIARYDPSFQRYPYLVYMYLRTLDILGYEFLIHKYVRALFLIAMYAFAPTAQMIFEYMSCVHVGDHHYVMFLYPSVDCFSSSYKSWLAFIIFLLLIYVMGLPIFMAFCAIWGTKKNYFTGADKQNFQRSLFFARFGIFFDCYRTEIPLPRWWEIALLARRVLLFASHILLITRRVWRSMGFFFIVMAALAAQLKVKPFAAKSDNTLEETMLFFQLILSGLTFALEAAKISQTPADILGVSILVSVAVVVAFVVLVVFICRARRQDANLVLARLRIRTATSTAQADETKQAQVG